MCVRVDQKRMISFSSGVVAPVDHQCNEGQAVGDNDEVDADTVQGVRQLMPRHGRDAALLH